MNTLAVYAAKDKANEIKESLINDIRNALGKLRIKFVPDVGFYHRKEKKELLHEITLKESKRHCHHVFGITLDTALVLGNKQIALRGFLALAKDQDKDQPIFDQIEERKHKNRICVNLFFKPHLAILALEFLRKHHNKEALLALADTSFPFNTSLKTHEFIDLTTIQHHRENIVTITRANKKMKHLNGKSCAAKVMSKQRVDQSAQQSTKAKEDTANAKRSFKTGPSKITTPAGPSPTPQLTPKKNCKKKKLGSNLTKELMKKNKINSSKFDSLMEKLNELIEDKNNIEQEIENLKNLTFG